MNKTKKAIEEKLFGRNPTLHVGEVSDRYKNIYRAQHIYNVYWLIYDENEKVVTGFNVCKTCKELIAGSKSTGGMKHLKSHECFKEYLKQKEEKNDKNDIDDEQKEDNETEPSPADLKLRKSLATAIIQCSEVISKFGDVNIEEMCAIMPSSLQPEEWLVTSLFILL